MPELPEKLRKYEYNLQAAGMGVFLFGAWGALRVVILFLLGDSRDELHDYVDKAGAQQWVIYVIMIIVIALVIGLHAYIGICASSEGLRRKRRWVYLILAGILAVSKFINIITDSSLSYILAAKVDTIVAFIVNVTSFLTIVSLIVNAIIVKVLRGKLRKLKVERLKGEMGEA